MKSRKDQLEKIAKHFVALVVAIMDLPKSETKPAVASIRRKNPKPATKKNYDKFRLINLSTGAENVHNKRYTAKAVFMHLVSLKPDRYSLSELKQALPIGSKLFMDANEAVQKAKEDRYFMDYRYLTSEGRE